MSTGKIKISLDMGYTSIGWAVASVSESIPRAPEFLGTGSVIFEPDRCLASTRRNFRRQRRHIRATRTRIQRLKTYLVNAGIITDAVANQRHLNDEPWRLAALALRKERVLTAEELWTVLLWYAHNRGYDGNRLWSAHSRGEADAEDIKKVEAAKEKMTATQQTSMAETILNIVTNGNPNGPALNSYKALSIAFPRATIVHEVTRILSLHLGKIKGLTEEVITTIIADPLEYPTILHANNIAPKAYLGGYLFGQTRPRFDNRLPTLCPISGLKTPNVATDAFLAFRWASLLCHVRVGADFNSLRALKKEEIDLLNAHVKKYGRFTPSAFKDRVREITNARKDNLNALFNVPDQETNLIRYPGLAFLDRSFKIDNFKEDEVTQQRLNVLSHALFKGKVIKGEELLPLLKDGKAPIDIADKHYQLPAMTGRAPYAKHLLKQAAETIFQGNDPWRIGGVLYRDATKEAPLAEGDIDKATNNHLVRHRIKIMLRLLNDIIKTYAENNPARVETIFIEVARDIKDFSGKKQKVIQSELKAILRSHEEAIKKFAKDLNVAPEAITASLARKERIAKDLNYTCPYTGKVFDSISIRNKMVDLDHILPRSKRTTDAMDALVLTFKEVNKKKGARTALEFIREFGGQTLQTSDGTNLQIRYESDYLRAIDKIKNTATTRQEKRVAQKRIEKLKMLHVEEADEMTDGMLTQTSAIMKLASRAIKGWFAMRKCKLPQMTMIPGFVTKEIRTGYDLLGILAQFDARLMHTYTDLEGHTITKAVPKGKMRNLTHMHHAVDAIAILLSGLLITPQNRVWDMMRKRHHSDDDKTFLLANGPFAWTNDNILKLQTLPPVTAASIRKALGELRTTRYTSKRLGRTVLEQTQWRVEKVENGRVYVRQRIDGEHKKDDLAENAVYGLHPKNGQGKLTSAKAVYIGNANYGVALCKQPKIIRDRFVWQQLKLLAEENGGQPPAVLRKGDLVRINNQVWVIRSIKDNKGKILIDYTVPYNSESLKNKVPYCGINKTLQKLIETNAIELLNVSLTGIPACPIML